MVRRGWSEVKIKTINGSFRFAVRRYETSEGVKNWINLTDRQLSKHYESEQLQEFALRYCTLLSYERVSQLVWQRCGTTRLSDRRLFQMVEQKADKMALEQKQLIAQKAVQPEAVKAVAVD